MGNIIIPILEKIETELTERLSNLPKVTQLISGKGRHWI